MNITLSELADLADSASERFSEIGSLEDFHYDETAQDFASVLKLIAASIRTEGSITDDQFGQLASIFCGLSAWMDFVGDASFQDSMLKQLQEIDNTLLDGRTFDRHHVRLFGLDAMRSENKS